MKKQNKIIYFSVIVLLILVGVLSFVNHQNNSKLDDGISIYKDDKQIATITQDMIDDSNQIDFKAYKKKDGKVFEEYNFTGVALVYLLEEKDIDILPTDVLFFQSKDGYTVELTGLEVLDTDNVMLITKENTQPLDVSWGDYGTVIRKDDFSKRWSKQLLKITIENE